MALDNVSDTRVLLALHPDTDRISEAVPKYRGPSNPITMAPQPSSCLKNTPRPQLLEGPARGVHVSMIGLHDRWYGAILYLSLLRCGWISKWSDHSRPSLLITVLPPTEVGFFPAPLLVPSIFIFEAHRIAGYILHCNQLLSCTLSLGAAISYTIVRSFQYWIGSGFPNCPSISKETSILTWVHVVHRAIDDASDKLDASDVAWDCVSEISYILQYLLSLPCQKSSSQQAPKQVEPQTTRREITLIHKASNHLNRVFNACQICRNLLHLTFLPTPRYLQDESHRAKVYLPHQEHHRAHGALQHYLE